MKKPIAAFLLAALLLGLCACGGSAADSSSGKNELDPAEVADYWQGRWYGWRVVNAAWGSLEELENGGWDVVADIRVDGLQGTLTFWDYEESEETPGGSAEIYFVPGTTPAGKLISWTGEAFGIEIGEGDWQVDPGDSDVAGLEHMIDVDGIFVDPTDKDDGYEYRIYLRPWGMSWEDLREIDPSLTPFEDMIPFHYDDWYRPQIPELAAENGQND